MTTFTALRRSIGAELYKFRRTFLFWFLILGPAFVPLINLIVFLSKGPQIVGEGTNPWTIMLPMSIDPGNFLFPFFVMIVALFVSSIEHHANTWKLIYAQPLSRAVVYTAKVITFVLMILLSLLLFGVFALLVGLSLRVLAPDLGFDQAFDLSRFFTIPFKVFLTTLGYASIQFWLSQRSKNVLLALGIGIGGFISFLILVQGWKYVEYHPYGYQILGLGDYQSPEYSWLSEAKFIYRSLGLATLIFVLAGVDMQRKRIV